MRRINVRAMSIMASAISAVAALMPGTARGQIFVAGVDSGTVGEYTLSGTPINADLISGLNNPNAIALAGSDLFVLNGGGLGEYTTSGATVNASLIPGTNLGNDALAVSGSDIFAVTTNEFGIPEYVAEYTTSGATVNSELLNVPGAKAIAVVGSDIFVASSSSGTIGEFTTSGATVNADLISGLNGPVSITVSNSDLFVGEQDSGTVGEYTTSGATVNADLISGLDSINQAGFLAFSGSDLLVTNDGQVGEYTTSGSVVNASLISLPPVAPGEFDYVTGLAVEGTAVPEPATVGLLGIAATTALLRRHRSAKRHYRGSVNT